MNNFGPNWVEIVFLLENIIFWENWLILLLSTYCAPLCYNVSKQCLEKGRSWDLRPCSFEQNWTQISYLCLEGIFLKNWLSFKSDFCQLHLHYQNTTKFKQLYESGSQNTSLHSFWTNWSRAFFEGKLSIVTFFN